MAVFVVGADCVFYDVEVGADEHLVGFCVQSLKVGHFFEVGFFGDEFRHHVLDLLHLVEAVEVLVVFDPFKDARNGFVVEQDMNTHG